MTLLPPRFCPSVALLLTTLLAPLAVADPAPGLDELLGLEPEAGESAPPSTQTPPPGGLNPDVAERVAGRDEAEPFVAAAERMERAAERLGRGQDPGLDTQRLQEDVLARLDQLIAQALENPPPPGGGGGSGGEGGTPTSPSGNGDASPGANPGPGSGGGGAAPGRPSAVPGSSGAASPGSGGGPAGTAAASTRGPLREVRREWGVLAPRVRDALSNGLDEPFSPVYRRQTEAFYRRLAEEAAP